jgi:hypothetical protein
MIHAFKGANWRLLWKEKGKPIEGRDFFSLETARDFLEFKKMEQEASKANLDLEPIIKNIKRDN